MNMVMWSSFALNKESGFVEKSNSKQTPFLLLALQQISQAMDLSNGFGRKGLLLSKGFNIPKGFLFGSSSFG